MYHNPVLLTESIDALNIDPTGNYADVTFGGGSHSQEILKHLTTGKLLAIDQDSDVIPNLPQSNNFLFASSNFGYLKNQVQSNNLFPLSGILADLGVSSHQFDTPSRGFSTRFEGPIDMRMNQNQEVSAFQILNQYPQDDLQYVFSRYGEIKNAISLSKTIITARLNRPIEKIEEFKTLLKPLLKRGKENQYLAQVFQALRIEVNKELEALEKLLLQSVDLLKSGGRLVIISYHSLEDRMVKNFFNKGKFTGEVEKDIYGNQKKPFQTVFRHAIIPSQEENEMNKRSRSAKMRVAEKI